jgi:hypothetical protein
MNIHHSVYPRERGEVAHNLGANPVAGLELARERSWVLGDAKNNDVSTGSIDNVGVHPKC